ncbi:type III secretion inner membrane ring lipoprotein SctJ [Burkholderia humptydooensis]|uniref:Lipoprotein n=3 Tax=Burkholderia humptydooensis TaxID=430531 RepID=A0A7U4SV19_9BURK|nr:MULTISPECIES: type III secretion inner membrane ring lipoprotein SctJ [Burkholderia]AJY39283.1 type III secretion apparatus lipoprotein, YscJ/HrcJ family [Burkholderia sp. 2002721687]ALX45362.1 type III secretion system protein [Burkholderia humptydooensis]EIP85444.1 type III secretion system BasJ [Burkholderia humptydooensis MSMB43]QPS46837.1 type III secretion inner membrane ring lipoprotein SctJ [Burkholderia humptydooensis]
MKRFVSFSLLPALLLLAACNQQELLKNLTEQQANDVVAVLQAHDLAVRKEDLGKTGYAVSVEQADFPTAVDLLRQYNLPSQARVQIAQAFPADALVASPQAEQARLLSAVEQRLEQNLAALQNVVSARVQVSYPLKPSDSGKPDARMHVAALLTYRNDVNADILVSEVKRFVKNSFTNIDYDDISVILYRAPSLFRGAPTPPASHAGAAWLYWLAAIPVALAAAAAGGLACQRRRRAAAARDASASTAPDGPVGAAAPDITDAPAPIDALDAPGTAAHFDAENAPDASHASRGAPPEPRR